MKKLLLALFVIAITSTVTKAQCPPGAFAYQSLYPQCPTGCGVLLLGWPEGVLVNIYGGSPLSIITSATVSGTLGNGGTGDAFTCVPCNTPLIYASSTAGATSGCVIATIGIVPIKLFNFSAKVEQGNICTLKWTTSQETNAVKYSIQKSDDGRNFTDIASLKGTLLTTNSYSYKDAIAKNGTFYYRIKAIELSGSITYSEIAQIKNESAIGFSIYPNPASSDEIKMNLSSKILPATIEIINAQGNSILVDKTSQSLYSIRKNLPRGVYVVKVTGNNNISVTERLIKN